MHGQVADPLQGDDNVQGSDDEAQVGGHRLFAGHDLVHVVLDLVGSLIDRVFPHQDVLGQLLVLAQQRLGRLAHRRLDRLGQVQQALLQFLDLALELMTERLRLTHGCLLRSLSDRRAGDTSDRLRPVYPVAACQAARYSSITSLATALMVRPNGPASGRTTCLAGSPVCRNDSSSALPVLNTHSRPSSIRV